MWCLSTEFSQVSPLATCGRNRHVTFLPNPEQLHTPRLTLRQNAFTVKTRHLDHHYCTHANVSGRNHFVCLTCSLYMFCAAPPYPPVIDAHTHFCYWAPDVFLSQSLILFRPGRPGLVQRGADPDPAASRHRVPVWSLSELFFLFVRSKLLSSFRTSPVQRPTAHNFSLHS